MADGLKTGVSAPFSTTFANHSMNTLPRSPINCNNVLAVVFSQPGRLFVSGTACSLSLG